MLGKKTKQKTGQDPAEQLTKTRDPGGMQLPNVHIPWEAQRLLLQGLEHQTGGSTGSEDSITPQLPAWLRNLRQPQSSLFH